MCIPGNCTTDACIPAVTVASLMRLSSFYNRPTPRALWRLPNELTQIPDTTEAPYFLRLRLAVAESSLG